MTVLRKNDLKSSPGELARFLREWCNAPVYKRILIVEDDFYRYVEKDRILTKSALSTPEEISDRFDELLGRGADWINLHAAGIIDDALIVVIEKPKRGGTCPRERVSVNPQARKDTIGIQGRKSGLQMGPMMSLETGIRA